MSDLPTAPAHTQSDALGARWAWLLAATLTPAVLWVSLGVPPVDVFALGGLLSVVALARSRSGAPLALQVAIAVAVTVASVVAFSLTPTLGDLSGLISSSYDGWYALCVTATSVGLGGAAGWVARVLVFGP